MTSNLVVARMCITQGVRTRPHFSVYSSMAPSCAACTVLRFDYSVLQTEHSARMEELHILRKAQNECGEMAAQIVALQECVEEQRRHLQSQSIHPKDPGVGIFTLLQDLSASGHKREMSICESYDERIKAMQTTQTQQYYYFAGQIAQLQTELAAANEQLGVLKTELASKTEEANVLLQCVAEQRRHMALVPEGKTDVDVGLMPLVRKGIVVNPASLQALVDKGVNDVIGARVDAAVSEAMVDNVCTLQSVKDMMWEYAEFYKQEAESLKLQYGVMKAKYADKCTELDVLHSSSHSSEEVEVLKADKEALLNAKHAVEKERDTAIKGIRHWQAESARVTNDLVAVMSHRDGLHIKLYTAHAELQNMAAHIVRLREEQETSEAKYQKLLTSLSGVMKEHTETDKDPALQLQLLMEEEEEEPVVEGEKKNKKKKNKKGKK